MLNKARKLKAASEQTAEKQRPDSFKEDLNSTRHSRSEERSVSPQNFKTELCRNFITTGCCAWGTSCCFAHGKDEIRGRNINPVFYKTKLCKNYHYQGFCCYANRCQYYHFKRNHIFREIRDVFEKKLLSNEYSTLQARLQKTECQIPRLKCFCKIASGTKKAALYDSVCTYFK